MVATSDAEIMFLNMDGSQVYGEAIKVCFQHSLPLLSPCAVQSDSSITDRSLLVQEQCYTAHRHSETRNHETSERNKVSKWSMFGMVYETIDWMAVITDVITRSRP